MGGKGKGIKLTVSFVQSTAKTLDLHHTRKNIRSSNIFSKPTISPHGTLKTLSSSLQAFFKGIKKLLVEY